MIKKDIGRSTGQEENKENKVTGECRNNPKEQGGKKGEKTSKVRKHRLLATEHP